MMVLYTPLGASWLNITESMCSATWLGGPWKANIPKAPKRLSNGSKPQHAVGTAIRHLLSGVVAERHGGHALGRSAMPWEGQELVVDGPFGEEAERLP